MASDKERAIEKIISNFNFNRVHKAMESLDWKWATTEFGVPSMGQLVLSAITILQDTYDLALREKTTCSMSTGGFKATAHVDIDTKEIYNIELLFVLSNWDADVIVDQKYF